MQINFVRENEYECRKCDETITSATEAIEHHREHAARGDYRETAPVYVTDWTLPICMVLACVVTVAGGWLYGRR